jgi:hypothetical protein
MKEVISHDLLDNWFPSGGELYVAFHQVGRYSFWGTYGDTEDLTNLRTGKWSGHVSVMSTPLPEVTAGTLAPSSAGESVAIPLGPPDRETVFAPGGEPCAMLLVRVPKAGEFSMAFQTKPDAPDTRLRVMLDNAPFGAASIPSESIRGRISAGIHSLFVFLDGKDPLTLLPGKSAKLTAEQIEQP